MFQSQPGQKPKTQQEGYSIPVTPNRDETRNRLAQNAQNELVQQERAKGIIANIYISSVGRYLSSLDRNSNIGEFSNEDAEKFFVDSARAAFVLTGHLWNISGSYDGDKTQCQPKSEQSSIEPSESSGE